MSSKSKQLAKMSKNALEEIVISESEWKGKTYIDIRVWVKRDGTEELIPTRKGISVNREDWGVFLKLLEKVDNNK